MGATWFHVRRRKSRKCSTLRFAMLVAGPITLAGAPNARAQDADEVKRLRERIELLEAKLKLAEREIQDLKEENKKLKAGGAKEPAAGKDVFAEGAVWSGKRFFDYMKNDPQTIAQVWEFKIASRAKGTFKGKMTLDSRADVREYDIEGTINGNSNYFTAKKGKFDQWFRGELRGGAIRFNLGGLNDAGGPVKGTAKAEPR